MSFTTIPIHRDAPAKPALGAACNGCGACCAMETCPAARIIFRQRGGPCPGLRWMGEDGRYRCGLLLNPSRYLHALPRFLEPLMRRLLARWIAAGTGCDADIQLVTGAEDGGRH